jgi:hypothetical protein
MVRVGKDDRRAKFLPKVALSETLNGCLGADRHEYGSGDVAMIGVQDTGSRPSLGTLGKQFEGDLSSQLPV